MKNVAVVYWSGTGNTEAMAEAVVKGAQSAGASAAAIAVADFDAANVGRYDAFAFGCPAMGAEELEETEFEPMFSGCEAKLANNLIALFGSYGWGDGEWMRNWQDDVTAAGANLVAEPVICNDAPDADATAACNALGKALA